MTQAKEPEMNAIDIPCADALDQATVLGVASTDTKGGALVGEEVGNRSVPGIAED